MSKFLNLGLKGSFLIVFVVMQSYFVLAQINTVYGEGAGQNNTGLQVSFYGFRAGHINAGNNNNFFGLIAGQQNTTGSYNSFFGSGSGGGNTTGSYNAFFGESTGGGNGNNNSIFGAIAGQNPAIGSGNTLIGFKVNSANSLTNATAIGAFSFVSQNNSLVLGSISGINSATANTNVGIGTTAPQQNLHVQGNEILSTGIYAGFKFRNRNSTSSNDDWVWYSDGNVARFWRSGVGDLLTVKTNGLVTINALGIGGFIQLCRNGLSEISNCSSSIRYKSNVNSFTSGLDLIKRLRPVSFNWTQNNQFDFGLVAEDVAEVEPLLATYNSKGEVEGVKYDRVGVVLINAVNQQQSQIELLQKQFKEQREIIKHQQLKIDSLKKVFCLQNPTAELCQ